MSERLSERDIRHRLAAAQRLQLRLRYLIHRPGWLIFQFQHFTGPRQRFLDLRRVAVKTNTVGWDDRLQLGELGINKDNIHYECFGPHKVL